MAPKIAVNYILDRHFVSENAWPRRNCEVAEYLYTFSVQTNLFSRIIGGLVKLVDLLKRGGGIIEVTL